MSVENELKAIRYLINDLILYIYDVRVRLDELAPKKRKYKIGGEPNANGNSIKFDLFSIANEKYNNLLDKYGVDIVNSACVKLDEFIKINEYIPFGNAGSALDRRFIKEALFDYNNKKDEASKPLVVVNEEVEEDGD